MSDFIQHPLDPLRADEISATARILRDALHDEKLIFRVIALSEPPKVEMIPYLAAEHSGGGPLLSPSRVAMAQYFTSSPRSFQEAMVDLGTRVVFSQEILSGKHPFSDANDMQQSEVASLADSRVRAAIDKLELPENATVVVEPWTYAPDGRHDISRKIIMCYFYMRLSENPDANYYAYPLDICAEMSGEQEVLNVFCLPSAQNDCMTTDMMKIKKFSQRKIDSTSEYHPDLTEGRRTTIKPYQIVQSDGPSFKIEGNLITWEEWRFRIGFNYREGLTIHDIRFDGRSIFYRLSLSEMFVPYGDPRAPYPGKAAFDLGNDGAGINANNLKNGCDCLGSIVYFDAWHHDSAGDPVKMPHVICCHEIDDGILWKHTNYRTGNAVVARSRVLVLQTIITVSNYEYVFAYQFSQDASLNYEVRATGILSTVPIDIGDSVPYGTVVAPGVLAPYHQHLFCLRIDPFLEGPLNSLLVEESVPMPLDATNNPFGVGYVTTSQIIEHEAAIDTDVASNRTFVIINESVLNPVSGKPVGYRLVPQLSQMLLAHPSSLHARRAEFATRPVWVTRFNERERFVAGRHTMQSPAGEGVGSWIRDRKTRQQDGTRRSMGTEESMGGGADEERGIGDNAQETSVRNQDIVLWHTFGTTHNPRVEEWPVMAAEKMVVGLRPCGFFERNPAGNAVAQE